MKLGNDIIFRQTEEKDRGAIRALLNLSFDRVYARYAKLSFESLAQSLVVEEDTRVIGVINWRILRAQGEQIGYIFWLAIHPDFRRKGIGEKLMWRTLEILDEHDLQVLLTSVEKRNLPSRSLFEKLGFTRISKAEIRRRFGKESPKLLREMWVMPWEEVFMR